MIKLNALKLEIRHRDGGNGKTPRDYFDFVIDGEPLSEKVGGDFASCLGWFVPAENERAIHRLLLEGPADCSFERNSLYVCPECGDLGCGAVTVVFERAGDKVIWRGFGYQNNYQDEVVSAGFEGIGPYTFDNAEYEDAIARARLMPATEQTLGADSP
jgi:hypothetical protein